MSTGVGGDHPAWDIIIGKLDFQSQMKLSQQNHRLADVVAMNAEHELRKFQRHIREDKYMLVRIELVTMFDLNYIQIELPYFSARKYSNPKNWSFYRALIWICEEQNKIQTRSKKQNQ